MTIRDVQKLSWSLVAAAARGDDEAREALLADVRDLETALDLVTGLATSAAAVLGWDRDPDDVLSALQVFLLTLAAEEGGPSLPSP